MSCLPLRIVPIALVSLALPGCKQEVARENALRARFPEGMGGLSSKSRQGARDYAFAWIKSFELMGTSGLHEFEEMAFKEALPNIEALERGNAAEQTAFKAGLKIHAALQYLGKKLKAKEPLDNAEFNALLRYTTGQPIDRKALAKGVMEMLLDYLQMADESVFLEFWETQKNKELSLKQP
jgi:hypothetical protein